MISLIDPSAETIRHVIFDKISRIYVSDITCYNFASSKISGRIYYSNKPKFFKTKKRAIEHLEMANSIIANSDNPSIKTKDVELEIVTFKIEFIKLIDGDYK
jgi:hypothetical protein